MRLGKLKLVVESCSVVAMVVDCLRALTLYYFIPYRLSSSMACITYEGNQGFLLESCQVVWLGGFNRIVRFARLPD